MELRIRKWKGPAVAAAPKHRHAELAFINVSAPEEMQDKRNQHKVRRHVMKDIGFSRRRSTVVDTPLPVALPRSLAPVPAYLGQMRVCHYFQRIFRAIVVFDDEILTLALSDAAPDFSQPLNLDARSVERQPIQTMTMLKYTSSLGLVRHQLLESENMSSHSATIGTIICLAFYDVSDSELQIVPVTGSLLIYPGCRFASATSLVGECTWAAFLQLSRTTVA